jgi:hypothetical protein
VDSEFHQIEDKVEEAYKSLSVKGKERKVGIPLWCLKNIHVIL